MEDRDRVKYKISILGDSISTYEGYNPPGYSVYYTGDRAYDNGVLSVVDTWWKQVIDGVGGELCVNNSYSGSLVYGDSASSARSERRCSALHGANKPDLILVYMGTNDRGYGINIRNFYEAYRTMLQRIKKNYPAAKIVCATLLLGYRKSGDRLNAQSEIAELDYNQAVRLAVEHEDCLLADLALFKKCYETLDGCHPTKDGHSLIAKLWLDTLKSILK